MPCPVVFHFFQTVETAIRGRHENGDLADQLAVLMDRPDYRADDYSRAWVQARVAWCYRTAVVRWYAARWLHGEEAATVYPVVQLTLAHVSTTMLDAQRVQRRISISRTEFTMLGPRDASQMDAGSNVRLAEKTTAFQELLITISDYRVQPSDDLAGRVGQQTAAFFICCGDLDALPPRAEELLEVIDE